MELEPVFFEFSADKNHQLKVQRGICFEEIIAAIENGQLLDTLRHPNQEKYPSQKVYVVGLGNYVFLVPFVRNGNAVFLKTIIPSRKATKRYGVDHA